jgi:hypothetical protein
VDLLFGLSSLVFHSSYDFGKYRLLSLKVMVIFFRAFSTEWWFSLAKLWLPNDWIPHILLLIYQSVPNWRHEVLIPHLI